MPVVHTASETERVSDSVCEQAHGSHTFAVDTGNGRVLFDPSIMDVFSRVYSGAGRSRQSAVADCCEGPGVNLGTLLQGAAPAARGVVAAFREPVTHRSCQ